MAKPEKRFGIRISSLIRISGFGIRILPDASSPPLPPLATRPRPPIPPHPRPPHQPRTPRRGTASSFQFQVSAFASMDNAAQRQQLPPPPPHPPAARPGRRMGPRTALLRLLRHPRNRSGKRPNPPRRRRPLHPRRVL